jgi:hypothetical protein
MMLRATSWRARLHLARRRSHDGICLIIALWGTSIILVGAGLARRLGGTL